MIKWVCYPIYTHTNPWENWSNHICNHQTDSPLFCVAWCLIWWFAILEEVWSYMIPNVITGGVIKQDRTKRNPIMLCKYYMMLWPCGGNYVAWQHRLFARCGQLQTAIILTGSLLTCHGRPPSISGRSSSQTTSYPSYPITVFVNHVILYENMVCVHNKRFVKNFGTALGSTLCTIYQLGHKKSHSNDTYEFVYWYLSCEMFFTTVAMPHLYHSLSSTRRFCLW